MKQKPNAVTRRGRRRGRKQSTPGMIVDWSAPVRHVQHIIMVRGQPKTIKVPVFKGLDTRTAKSLWNDKKRHDAGRWAGSRYAPRNETGGHVLVPATTRVVRGEVRHVTWSIVNDASHFNPTHEVI